MMIEFVTKTLSASTPPLGGCATQASRSQTGERLAELMTSLPPIHGGWTCSASSACSGSSRRHQIRQQRRHGSPRLLGFALNPISAWPGLRPTGCGTPSPGIFRLAASKAGLFAPLGQIAATSACSGRPNSLRHRHRGLLRLAGPKSGLFALLWLQRGYQRLVRPPSRLRNSRGLPTRFPAFVSGCIWRQMKA